MKQQYWIGDFFIDASRNQITQKKFTQTLAPKALAVLTYLAENQGQVVSQDALLNGVWPNAVVSPNTLQRSIAQLRKALGDDGKAQAYIKTHAKQGYSLEREVRWQNNAKPTLSSQTHSSPVNDRPLNNVNRNPIQTNQPQASKHVLRLIAGAAVLLVLSIAGYNYLTPEPMTPLTFDQLRSLTTTDDKEFDATYSPDGQYIVFQRFLNRSCVNKLWAKHISTQKETQLTSEWGNYGSHSFAKNGEKLVFLATEPCNQPIPQSSCYNLMSLDFKQALVSPQNPNQLLQCQNTQIRKPIWLNNNHVAMLQRNSNRWKLISYSISENTSTDLYDLKEGNIVDYAYSVRGDLIAVTSIHGDGQHYLEMLNPEGHILSSHVIKRPPEMAQFRNIYPSFDPLNDRLIFSTGKQLFTLAYDGEVSKINIPLSEVMGLPEFHPDGKSILFIKGAYDSDVVKLTLNSASNDPMIQSDQAGFDLQNTGPSFERTNLGEDYAKFQPDGELIAFWSERSGEQQIWVSDGGGPLQLTNYPTDSYIRGFDWADDGQSLLVNANNVLTQVSLDSSYKSFQLDHPVIQLYQWDSQDNSALLLIQVRGILKLVDFNLSDSTYRELTDKKVLWALRSDGGRLIYKDYSDQFWQTGPVEAQLILQLNEQGGKSKSFMINGEIVYAINDENQLWSYDLNTEIFTILGTVSDDVDYLTDINQTEFLMTVQVSAKKEVVELTLSE